MGCGNTAAKQTGSWQAGHGLEPHLQELSGGEEETQGRKGQFLRDGARLLSSQGEGRVFSGACAWKKLGWGSWHPPQLIWGFTGQFQGSVCGGGVAGG